ncbi:hypothetical protein BHE74_00024946 [Ensete ventricosum]|uniref:Uncharacterized protein n=1 Tax=Ensete ventricosum TaxID=4639 RepID=A0A426YU90_ENSVE|nr:hypothetical protein B296_00026981 [Ensete ventricosum]RWW67596.1 hypothetical protein BHE74_00024946 [Ensete ventricosum]RZR76209.1 hypothetical protein BHM03_00000842 [Ensete ventricosum]
MGVQVGVCTIQWKGGVHQAIKLNGMGKGEEVNGWGKEASPLFSALFFVVSPITTAPLPWLWG